MVLHFFEVPTAGMLRGYDSRCISGYALHMWNVAALGVQKQQEQQQEQQEQQHQQQQQQQEDAEEEEE